jgi:mRNA interferase MazF
MKRGEVWRDRLPYGLGHVQAGERPAVLVQDDAFNSVLPTTLVVPFTSNRGAARFPGTLLVFPDGSNGLSVPSVALVFQLRVVDRRDCLTRLGVLAPHVLDDLFAFLDLLTGR